MCYQFPHDSLRLMLLGFIIFGLGSWDVCRILWISIIDKYILMLGAPMQQSHDSLQGFMNASSRQVWWHWKDWEEWKMHIKCLFSAHIIRAELIHEGPSWILFTSQTVSSPDLHVSGYPRVEVYMPCYFMNNGPLDTWRLLISIWINIW